MSYRIDHTKSSKQNLAGLLNTTAKTPLKGDEFDVLSVSNLGAETISPNARVVLGPAQDSFLQGNTSATYDRTTLAKNHPTAGTKVFVDNGETHETVLAKILDRLRIVGDQVTVTNPARPPVGGEFQNYLLTTVSNCVLYRQSTLQVQATNRNAYVPQDPSVFLAVLGTENERTVYRGLGADMRAQLRRDSEARSLLRLLDAVNNTTGFKFKGGDLVFSNVREVNTYGANTLVDFELGPNSPYTLAGTLAYNRYNLTTVYNVPDEIYNQPDDQVAEAFFNYIGFPSENVVIRDAFASSGYKRIEYTTAPNSLVYVPMSHFFLLDN